MNIKKFVRKGVLFSVAVLVAVPVICVLLISPPFLGLYSFWERRNTYRSRLPRDPNVEHYSYNPPKNQLSALAAFKLFLKITLFPLYCYARGVGMLLGLPIYPATIFSISGPS